MNDQQAKFLLFKASAAYPNQIELEEETVAVWIERLSDVPFEWGLANLNFHIDTDSYFPKISNITRYDLQTLKNHNALKLETAKQLDYLERWSNSNTPPPIGYWDSIKAKLRGGGE